MKAAIRGIGVLGGFGYGLNELEYALTQSTPEPHLITLETSNGPIEVPALLAETAPLYDIISKRELRRSGHYIRMALLAANGTLDDAGIAVEEDGRMGIIVATGYGATCNTFDFQDSLINANEPCGSPTVFANSVHNAAASHLSISLKKMGPNLSVSHYDMSMPSALATAVGWLEEKRVDTVLVGGVDEYCKVLGYYWHCHRQASAPPASPELDVIGEGACFFVLGRAGEVESSYGMIDRVQLGHGAAEQTVLERATVFFLGTDSYSDCDTRYVDHLPWGAQVSVHSHVFGGIPIGIGFEVAIAALSLKTGRLFPSAPLDSRRLNGLTLTQPSQDRSHPGPIGCLKLGAGNAHGQILVSPL